MSRRSRADAAQRAAEMASEAGRQLAEHRQNLRTEPEPDSNGRVRDDGALPPPERKNEPRRAQIEEIEQREARLRGDPEATPEPVLETEPMPAPPSAEQILAANTPAPATEPAAEPAPAAESQPEMVAIKVDGEESLVPKSEVDEAGGVASYQIQKAGEKRLRAANEALAESKRVQAQMLDMMHRIMAPQQPQQPQMTPQDFLKSKIQQIQLGTPEEAAAALQEVLQRTQQPQVDIAAVEQRAMLRMRQQAAVDVFRKDYSDVLANPLVGRLAAQLETEGLQKGIPADFAEFYGNIGKQLRGAFGRPNQPAEPAAQTQAPTSATSEKEARKASIVTLPRTAGTRAAAPEEPKPETREQMLAQMRKARGQPTG